MAYKIAVASSDGVKVNQTFGTTKRFLIVEVDEAAHYCLKEERYEGVSVADHEQDSLKLDAGELCSIGRCGAGIDINSKVLLIEDCRGVICTKVGFQAQKQLERKLISSLESNCSVEEAVQKMINAFYREDHPSSLRE